MNFNSIDEILDFAIEKEQDAHDFYTDLAGKMKQDYLKKIFLDFAREERGHKEKLINIKAGKKLLPSEKKIVDLKIGDSLVNVEPEGDMDYQKALIIAMKAEKNAFILYTQLAEAADDDEIKHTMLMLAQEEAKHKLRFEVEYDDVILKEN